jgi:hypothetical protein
MRTVVDTGTKKIMCLGLAVGVAEKKRYRVTHISLGYGFGQVSARRVLLHTLSLTPLHIVGYGFL